MRLFIPNYFSQTLGKEVVCHLFKWRPSLHRRRWAIIWQNILEGHYFNNESAQTKMDQPQRSRNRKCDREENSTKELPSADQTLKYLHKVVQELWKAKKSWKLCCSFETKESSSRLIPTKETWKGHGCNCGGSIESVHLLDVLFHHSHLKIAKKKSTLFCFAFVRCINQN